MLSAGTRFVLSKLAGLPVVTLGLLALATTVFLVDLALRYTAPKSRAYAAWASGLRAIGSFWTAVILSIVYLIPVGLTNVVVRTMRRDLLDREIRKEPSYWHIRDSDLRSPEEASLRQF